MAPHNKQQRYAVLKAFDNKYGDEADHPHMSNRIRLEQGYRLAPLENTGEAMRLASERAKRLHIKLQTNQDTGGEESGRGS